MTAFLVGAYIAVAFVFAFVSINVYIDLRGINDDAARVWARRIFLIPIWPAIVIRWLADVWDFATNEEED